MEIKYDRPIIETKKNDLIRITVQHVFRANFNDTYWLDEIDLPISEIDRAALTWFDPFFGRSKRNTLKVAIVSCSDDQLVILEKDGDTVKENKSGYFTECVVTEDFDDSVFLAAHISLTHKR